MISETELHTHLLELAKSFHAFCVSNDLHYYILGGTSLGARRHHGFIPWDDDVDVGIPREDYDRLIKLKDRLPEHMEIMYYKNYKKAPMHYIKLIDNRTTLIEKKFPDLIEGLYIDVFPLDGAFNPSNNTKERLRLKLIYLLFATIVYHCRKDELNSFLKKGYRLFSRLFPLNFLHSLLEKLITKHSASHTDCIANLLGAWGIKEVVEKGIMGKPTLYKFEDTMLYGPEKIDAYLQCLYGNYMTLPPEEKRVFKHDYLHLDLNQPYKDYIKIHNQPK